MTPFLLQIYLPGIDGTGLAAFRQFPGLASDFALSTFSVPVSDRSSFTELVQTCATFMRRIAADTPPQRPIYLLGESFGGILALAVAIEAPEAVDRIVLVNPATAFLDSPWAEVSLLHQHQPHVQMRDTPHVRRICSWPCMHRQQRHPIPPPYVCAAQTSVGS